MSKVSCAPIVLTITLASMLLPFTILAQDTNVGDQLANIVEARRSLMASLSMQVDILERQIGEPESDLDTLGADPGSVASMLKAFPHLFPGETNPAADEFPGAIATSAAPDIWTDFAAFYELARKGSEAAASLAAAETEIERITFLSRLRTSCNECHERFLEYAPPSIGADEMSDVLKDLGF